MAVVFRLFLVTLLGLFTFTAQAVKIEDLPNDIDYDADRFLVKFYFDYNYDDDFLLYLEENGIEVVNSLNPNSGSDIFLLEIINDSLNLDYVMENIRDYKSVEFVEYNYYFDFAGDNAFVHPNDSSYDEQWALDDLPQVEQNLSNLDIELAWYITEFVDDFVTVGIIDSGVDFLNQDLDNMLAINTNEIPGDNIDNDNNGYIDDYYGAAYFLNPDLQAVLSERIQREVDLDYYSQYLRGIDYTYLDLDDEIQFLGNPSQIYHGSQVASVMAAEINNDFGIAGVTNNVRLVNYRVSNLVENPNDPGRAFWRNSAASLIAAFDYMIDREVDIINLSLAGNSSNSDIFAAQLAAVEEAGILLVAAANQGEINDNGTCASDDEITGIDLDANIRYPASHSLDFDNMIVVGSIDCDAEISTFSNYGRETVQLLAPGRNVVTISPGFNIFNDPDNIFYVPVNGTSLSTPMVAGVAAMLKSYSPELSLTEVKSYILDNVVEHDGLEDVVESGGTLNAALPLLKVPPRNFEAVLDYSSGEYVLTWDLHHYLDHGGYWIYHKGSFFDNGWRKLLASDDTSLSCLRISVEDLPNPDLDLKFRTDYFGIVSVFDLVDYSDLEFDYPVVASYLDYTSPTVTNEDFNLSFIDHSFDYRDSFSIPYPIPKYDYSFDQNFAVVKDYSLVDDDIEAQFCPNLRDLL